MDVDTTKDLDQLAEQAASDERIFEILITQYKPFIFSQVRKTLGKPFIDDSDDMLSIGLIAFYEAVRTYNREKGNFLLFAGTVIRCRVIDQIRKDKRTVENVVPLDDEKDEHEISILDKDVFAKYYEQVLIEQRQTEIELFNQDLAAWGITMRDVYKDAPKHMAKRDLVWEIVRKALANEEITEIITKKKYLPVALLEEDLKIHRKKIEKARRYIIACIIIAKGDYPLLRDYLHL